MEQKIYKSTTPGMTDKQFERESAVGCVSFISFERLYRECLGNQLKKGERLKGMVIDSDGIKLYLEYEKNV